MAPVTVDGARLEVFEQGSGPPVLVIHGAGSAGDLWSADLDWLVSRHRVIAYNRRGFPGSSPSPLDWPAHAADAAGLLEALDAAPAVVMAHSAGCTGALELAVRRPELVERLILLDPVVQARSCLTPRFVLAYLRARILYRLRGPRAGAEAWLRYGIGYRTGGSPFDDPGFSPERWESLMANAEGIFADLSSDRSSHLTPEDLRGIDRPIAIVAGELSVPTIRNAVLRLAGLLPQARATTISGAGHALSFDRPVEFRAAVDAALAA